MYSSWSHIYRSNWSRWRYRCWEQGRTCRADGRDKNECDRENDMNFRRWNISLSRRQRRTKAIKGKMIGETSWGIKYSTRLSTLISQIKKYESSSMIKLDIKFFSPIFWRCTYRVHAFYKRYWILSLIITYSILRGSHNHSWIFRNEWFLNDMEFEKPECELNFGRRPRHHTADQLSSTKICALESGKVAKITCAVRSTEHKYVLP